VNRRIGLILLFACHALALGAGCQHHPPPLEPGKSGLELRVVAEPKRGLQQRSSDSYSGLGTSDPFTQVDYESLSGVIVWIEPLDDPAPPAPAPAGAETAIELTDAVRPRQLPPWQGVAVGARLVFQNHSTRAQAIYSLSEGNEFDLGTIPAGARAEYVVRSQGLIEVLSESLPQPIARLYAAPGRQVQTVRAGETTRFANLPPGRYRVACWHERLPGSEQLIGLSPDKWSALSLKVSVNFLPAFARTR
jgi:hypothetical protein